MRVAELLLKILEDLLKADFDEFKWFLTLGLLGVCEPIPRSHLQDASRIETVDILLKRYGEEKAVKVTAEVLKKMKMNKATEDLMSSYAAGRSTPSSSPSSSSPSAPTPSSPVMAAQDGSVIIAPTITVGTTAACNISISN